MGDPEPRAVCGFARSSLLLDMRMADLGHHRINWADKLMIRGNLQMYSQRVIGSYRQSRTYPRSQSRLRFLRIIPLRTVAGTVCLDKRFSRLSKGAKRFLLEIQVLMTFRQRHGHPGISVSGISSSY
jgi:hypothetical protein